MTEMPGRRPRRSSLSGTFGFGLGGGGSPEEPANGPSLYLSLQIIQMVY